MTMMMMMMMMMIVLKAQFEIFYNLLNAPRTVANTYAEVARTPSCANHVLCNLQCAT